VLRAVVAQRLVLGPRGRVPAVELLTVTPAVANLIRTGKAAQVQSAMESQTAAGMQTLEASLAGAVQAGWLDLPTARAAARDPEQLAARVRLAGSANRGRPWR
jgi:twitching motility protein PilT